MVGPVAPCERAQFNHVDIAILDEPGHTPFDKAGTDLLFGFMRQRHERRRLVVTTNMTLARWSEVFLDATAATAVIDRIIRHATVLTTTDGSCRLKASTCNQALGAPQEMLRQ